jgi:hypothetical protein
MTNMRARDAQPAARTGLGWIELGSHAEPRGATLSPLPPARRATAGVTRGAALSESRARDRPRNFARARRRGGKGSANVQLLGALAPAPVLVDRQGRWGRSAAVLGLVRDEGEAVDHHAGGE